MEKSKCLKLCVYLYSKAERWRRSGVFHSLILSPDGFVTQRWATPKLEKRIPSETQVHELASVTLRICISRKLN